MKRTDDIVEFLPKDFLTLEELPQNFPFYSSASKNKEEKNIIESQYDLNNVHEDQKLIIDMLYDLSSKFEQHDSASAKKEDINSHDKSVKSTINESRQEITETIHLLHAEIRKNSLRHRLAVYTSIAVLISTALALTTLIIGQIVIMIPTASILLFGTILFWFMARLIPEIEEVPRENHK